jgi:hypothetical protein
MALVRSTESLRNEVKLHIERGDFDAALRLIHQTVNQVCCEPINSAQIFGSRLLDDLCQEVGAINWERIRGTEIQRMDNNAHPRPGKRAVYVASRLYPFGGHTAVLADIIRLSPPADSVILITGIGGPTDHAAIRHRFGSTPDVVFEFAPNGTHFDKLNWLQRRLRELAPDDVWLFNHHQDSVAIAGVQPNANYRLHYCHHGDHQLCLGVFLSYADHIDLHPMGFHHCRNALNIYANRYLPLVVKDLGHRPAAHAFKDKAGLVTCTAGSSNKVEIPYFIRYADVVPELLHASKGRHIHIGHLGFATLHRIRRGMRRLKIPASAFVHVPYVPSVWKALQDYDVDLYVASFPYGGGRTLIETMGAGIPAAIHSHCASRLLGAFDMSYEGALIWRSPNELYDHIRHIDESILTEQSRAARKRYEEFHRDEILRSALADHATPLDAPDLADGYLPDALQLALDISLQVNCAGAMRRFLARTARNLKWRLRSSGPG